MTDIQTFLNNFIVPRSGECYSDSAKKKNGGYLKDIHRSVVDMNVISQVTDYLETVLENRSLCLLDAYLQYARYFKLNGLPELEKLRIDKHANKAVKVQDELVLPDKDTLLKIYDKIPEQTFINVKHKCVLNLLLNESWILRTDLSTVKYRNYDISTDSYYKEGVIHFHELTKTKDENENRSLNDESIRLLDLLAKHSKSEYLFVESETKDKNDAFTSLVKHISEKYFALPYCINVFRKLKATRKVIDVMRDNSLNEKEKLVKLISDAKADNHSLETVVRHYLHTLPENKVDCVEPKYTTFYLNGNEIKLLSGSSIKIDGVLYEST